MISIPAPVTVNFRNMLEVVDGNECKAELRRTGNLLEDMIDKCNNPCFNRGILKFCERVNKYKAQTSKLSSAFHSFGSPVSSSRKICATASLKKARRGKIYVQPEAVKRRKSETGSKKPIIKGMRIKSNPFDKSVTKKRLHKFSANVQSNEAVPHKAGRTMSSKTKFLSPRDESKNNEIKKD